MTGFKFSAHPASKTTRYSYWLKCNLCVLKCSCVVANILFPAKYGANKCLSQLKELKWHNFCIARKLNAQKNIISNFKLISGLIISGMQKWQTVNLSVNSLVFGMTVTCHNSCLQYGIDIKYSNNTVFKCQIWLQNTLVRIECCLLEINGLLSVS